MDIYPVGVSNPFSTLSIRFPLFVYICISIWPVVSLGVYISRVLCFCDVWISCRVTPKNNEVTSSPFGPHVLVLPCPLSSEGDAEFFVFHFLPYPCFICFILVFCYFILFFYPFVFIRLFLLLSDNVHRNPISRALYRAALSWWLEIRQNGKFNCLAALSSSRPSPTTT